MKIGISSYSLSQAIRTGKMTIIDVLEWAADHGSEHVEIVPIGFSLDDDPALIEEIRTKADRLGILLSNYAIAANFVRDDERQYEAEIARVKKHVDIAAALGVTRMRHDVATRPAQETTLTQFYADLPCLTEACRQIADYARNFGITTSVENHGMYIQHSERIQTLVDEVDRANFRTTLDVGNFRCVDEDPVAAVKRNLPIASMIHLKDFYYRPSYRNPGEGWFQTVNGNYLRGAIFGQGDIDVWEVLRLIKASDYNGFLSLEFEGKEECEYGTRAGLINIRRIWESV
ncbi:sugar phosphate isomerase/epimerase [Paenibacillus contaminans]|uniref:Sugar phosphate isomerase/epimerase n=1 Tax=Paenibacillus contaminans TaxID=450362 RepID=A0A329MK30_9BACL|nr:sugar phosphate isomerase/epimerase family protein [Paenibacillus contaminans]RAV19083.1 sugar phosphate isomerase/epimerase [Paenibacillus contaminans]